MEKNEAGQEELSYHIFLFPFRWDYKAGDKEVENISFDKRTDTDDFSKVLTELDHWERKPFNIDKTTNYNEFVYFYDFVRDALYDSGKGNDAPLQLYQYKISGEAKYLIHIEDEDKTCYELEIDKILLHVYTTGVGILSYHLKNTNYKDRSDILKINEFGRRIYPQFLDEHSFTKATKGAFLADSIEVKFDEEKCFKEDFSYFDDIEKIRQDPGKLPAFITGLLSDRFVTKKSEASRGDIYIDPVVDDRMFVLCSFADDQLCTQLAKYDKSKGAYNYRSNDEWYKFLFIDTETPTCKSIPMKEELLEAHTYDRWIGKGKCILYGFSRYSFVILTTESSSFFAQHLKTVYLRMIILALVQRASVLRFSREVTHISALKKNRDTTKRIRSLHESYTHFANKIYFREVTAQEQGIDLYDRIVQVMKIERDVKDLNRQIDELHQYAALLEDKKNNRLLYILTLLGGLFVVPAFLISFMGLNISAENIKTAAPVKYGFMAGGIMLTAFLSLLWIFLRDRWNDDRISPGKRIVLFTIPVLILLMVLFLVLCLDIIIPGVGP